MKEQHPTPRGLEGFKVKPSEFSSVQQSACCSLLWVRNASFGGWRGEKVARRAVGAVGWLLSKLCCGPSALQRCVG